MTRPFIIQLIYLSVTFVLSAYIHPLFLMMLLLPLVINIVDLLNIDISRDSNLVFGTLYVFRTKKVHTEYGRFYIIVRKDRLHLFQDRILHLKHIDNQWFSTMDNAKEWIKKQCDLTTRSEREKDEILKNIKEWNGCVDLQSERDKKLDKLIK